LIVIGNFASEFCRNVLGDPVNVGLDVRVVRERDGAFQGEALAQAMCSSPPAHQCRHRWNHHKENGR